MDEAQLRALLSKAERDEYATCAILGKLQEFIIEVSRSSFSLSDIWGTWTPVVFEKGIKCWDIKKCTSEDCASRDDRAKCWLLDGTPCCTGITYSDKIAHCFQCEVMSTLRSNTPQFLNELINILIKFLMHRDKELLNIAIRDSLTKCYNRYYFDEYTDHLLKEADRHGDEITIMAIDIDKFKVVNDTYGHAVGDSVLIAVSELLTRAVRANDMIFRIGGDEFLVLFPRTTCCEIDSIKTRLISLIAEWNATSVLSEYVLRLSVGCVTWKPEEDFLSKIAEADKIMYEEKINGVPHV